MSKDRIIVIDRLFPENSSFLLNKKNIGFEIINFYKADNEENYIYLNANGFFKKDNKNLKGIDYSNCQIDVLFVVKNKDYKDRFQILGVARNVEFFPGSITGEKLGKNETNNGIQIKEIKKEGIKYGGQFLSDIMSENEVSKPETNIFITFKANGTVDKISQPNGTVDKISQPKFIIGFKTQDKQNSIKININLAQESLKSYLNGKNNQELLDFIDEQANWDKGKFAEKLSCPTELEQDKWWNIFKITGNEKQEKAFSNMLAYFIKNEKSVFDNFLICLNKDFEGRDFNNILVTREKNNIDLLIETDKEIIVIENKVESLLNGTCDGVQKEINNVEDENQRRVFQEQFNNCRTKNININQLAKYYLITEKKKLESNKSTHYFVLCPNYRADIMRDEIKNSLFGENYNLIKYNVVYDNLESLNSEIDEQDKDNFNQFIKAMNALTSEMQNQADIDAQKRFKNRIYNLNNPKKTN
jgi:hypothetical protein